MAVALRTIAVDLHDWSRNVLGDLEKRIREGKKLEVCGRPGRGQVATSKGGIFAL